jgi:hypothetical protein
MNRTLRRLALTMAAATALAAPWFAHANVFGTGNNGVYSEQQRFEKDKSKDKESEGGSSYGTPPSYRPAPMTVDTPTNSVPEPETLSLLAVGLLAVWAASRRRKD